MSVTSKRSKTPEQKRKHAERERKRRAENPDYHIKRKYGLSLEDYDRLVVSQGDKCAICSSECTGGRHRQWNVDHDHRTGEVRGLLCTRCNFMLGYAKDDTGILASAISYLQNPPFQMSELHGPD